MRTLIIALAGVLPWGASLGIARLLSGSMKIATLVFAALWLVAAAANMWVGVAQTGYSFQEELPISLLIFLLPAAVALLVT